METCTPHSSPWPPEPRSPQPAAQRLLGAPSSPSLIQTQVVSYNPASVRLGAHPDRSESVGRWEGTRVSPPRADTGAAAAQKHRGQAAEPLPQGASRGCCASRLLERSSAPRGTTGHEGPGNFREASPDFPGGCHRGPRNPALWRGLLTNASRSPKVTCFPSSSKGRGPPTPPRLTPCCRMKFAFLSLISECQKSFLPLTS